MKKGFIYIISNKKRTTLYVGVTNNLKRRITEHKEGIGSKFSEKYKLTDLLYFEEIPDIRKAIHREKQLKNWHRQWKLNLIKSLNPELKDLYWEL
jgi:putative endonuclease